MRLVFQDLSFAYGPQGPPIFNGLSLELDAAAGDFPAIILGPSGCGKTTLLRLAAGLLVPRSGRVVIEDGGPSISFVFQEPRLLPWLTVEENVALPLEKLLGTAAARRRARKILRRVSLEQEAGALPARLSGGQAQRAALARAFAYPGSPLFMDEPFHALDIPLRLALMDLTLDLAAEENRQIVAVTHDPREAVYLGSRVLVLGQPPRGPVFDERPALARVWGAPACEARLIEALRGAAKN